MNPNDRDQTLVKHYNYGFKKIYHTLLAVR